MKHKNRNRKFGRETDQRRAFLRSLAEALAAHGKITTTEARAKELRPYIERLITLAKKGTPAAEKLLKERLGTAKRAKLLIDLAKKAKQPTGYTRIVKMAPRKSDGSPMAIIQVIS